VTDAAKIFEDLFVLEVANNHWGQLDRGLRIIREYGRVARYNNVRAAIKLQFRDVESFVHPDYKDRDDVRYIKKTLATGLAREEFVTLIAAIRKAGCIPMATPFDEESVQFCVDLDLPIIKLASSDINDWVLIEAIAATRKPVIASTGGSSVKDVDDLVTFFARRSIPLALNHCVSLYPSEDSELELNQIDWLRDRYPGLTIGFSTHEYHDWSSSMLISYAKGARSWERHVDIDADGIPVSPYCSLPEQVDEWFRSYHKAREMCGAPGTSKRIPSKREVEYLDGLVRGVYAKRDLPAGHRLTEADLTLAIPLLQGQLSCRELIAGEILAEPVQALEPVRLDALANSYSRSMRARIAARGLPATSAPTAASDTGNLVPLPRRRASDIAADTMMGPAANTGSGASGT
jgi:N-acetylneuraminate synthase